MVLSVSRNEGKSWSKPIRVNRTPYSLIVNNPPGYQAFNGNILFLPNNIVAIIYYDYRNYEANSDIASTDAWLALYRETKDAHGGSTHQGLDFLTEIRLSNPSFDANIATSNSVNGIVSGLGNVLGIAGVGNMIFTAYPVTVEDDPANIINDGYPGINPQYAASVDFNRRLDTHFQRVLLATDQESHQESQQES
jgi:hypothetical protein